VVLRPGAVVREIAGILLDDGIEFDSERAVAEVIREEDEYSGIRVTLDGKLWRAAIRLHVDVNIGDPIWPEPQYVSFPRLLDGVLQVCGYPLEWCLPRKSRHRVSGATFRASLILLELPHGRAMESAAQRPAPGVHGSSEALIEDAGH
jgi:hypothetical protein